MPFCSHCGIKLSGSENFCPNCGTSIAHSKDTSGDKQVKESLQKCPSCGTQVENCTDICPLCGYEFIDSSSSPKLSNFTEDIKMFCPFCGKEYKKKKEACTHCGTRLTCINFLPGYEPKDIKQGLNDLLNEINCKSCDFVIFLSHWDHQRWDLRTAKLSNILGYPSCAAFLNAYGFIILDDKTNICKDDFLDKEILRINNERMPTYKFPYHDKRNEVSDKIPEQKIICSKTERIPKDFMLFQGMWYGVYKNYSNCYVRLAVNKIINNDISGMFDLDNSFYSWKSTINTDGNLNTVINFGKDEIVLNIKFRADVDNNPIINLHARGQIYDGIGFPPFRFCDTGHIFLHR